MFPVSTTSSGVVDSISISCQSLPSADLGPTVQSAQLSRPSAPSEQLLFIIDIPSVTAVLIRDEIKPCSGRFGTRHIATHPVFITLYRDPKISYNDNLRPRGQTSMCAGCIVYDCLLVTSLYCTRYILCTYDCNLFDCSRLSGFEYQTRSKFVASYAA